MPATHVAQLQGLPPEILQAVFCWLSPADLISLPLTCHALNAFMKTNSRAVCRDVYLKNFDIPSNRDLDWTKEVHDILKLEAICNRRNAKDKKHELPFVYEIVNRLLQNASSTGESLDGARNFYDSRNARLLNQLFTLASNSEAFLQRSSLFERLRPEPRAMDVVPSELHQMSAKLHCLYGRPIFSVGRRKIYPFARAKVYDLRQYTTNTKWGPFTDDDTGRVDWEKVEAIIVVLGYNASRQNLTSRVFYEAFQHPFSGCWSQSYKPYPIDWKPDPTKEIYRYVDQDPYGITGTWYRIVCFLDWNDFLRFNFPHSDETPENVARDPIENDEATRIILMKLHVTGIEPPGPEDGQELPVVHFEGFSCSLDDFLDENANSRIQGSVRLTQEGEVRWTTYSILQGQRRWKSESIQIGGVRSARGVFGHWFDHEYDFHGPCGPTAFWKTTDIGQEVLPTEDPFLPMDDDDDDDDDGDAPIDQAEMQRLMDIMVTYLHNHGHTFQH